ncbi:MAG: hypothetical protein AB7F40_10635 [Victivallaceae bacterium]|nr:hypothetical protein [Victivallaceae bacterium]
MEISIFGAAILASLAGVCFAGIGIAYRFGEPRGVSPMQSFFFASLIGAGWCLASGYGELSSAPWFFVPAAFALGLSQYLPVRLMQIILKLGPLSPMWSALMLYFVPVILFSSLFLGEPFTLWNLSSVLAAVVAVLAAAVGGADSGPGRPAAGRRGRMVYGLLLLALLFANCLLGMGQKLLATLHTADGYNLMDRCGMLFLGVMYLGIALPLFVNVSVGKGWNFKSRMWPAVALLAAAGTVGGMMLQTFLLPYPAALYFTCSSSASVLFAAIFSAAIFREKRTKWWYATVGATVLSILLTNGGTVCEKLCL